MMKGSQNMAHQLNELAEGVHSFVSAREDAWHTLGITLDSGFNAEQALEHAHLGGWNVRKVPLTLTDVREDGVTSMEVPNRWATVYTNPVTQETRYLGVVGGYYSPIQNEEHVDLLNALVDESGAHFETAGSLKDGREIFVSMKLPESMQVGGVDPVDLYLIALNSHDGSSPFRFLVSPIRVVCANTQSVALAQAKSSFSIRHVGKNAGVISEARQALELTWKYLGEFQQEVEKMIDTPLKTSTFEDIVRNLFNVPEDAEEAGARAFNSATAHFDGVMELWHRSETLEGIDRTAWRGLQAVTEYTDHFMSVRNTRGDEKLSRAIRVVGTASPVVKLKEDAHRALALV
jgi:phage/plasmid-like protein (TIGR03299 family)